MVSMTTSTILFSEGKQCWINLNQILNWAYSFFIIPVSRHSRELQPQISFPVAKFHFAVLPEKRECNFLIPVPFPWNRNVISNHRSWELKSPSRSPLLWVSRVRHIYVMNLVYQSDLHLENWFSPTDPHVSLLEITFQVPWTWRTGHFPGNQVGFSLGWFPNLYFLQYNWGTWLDYNKVSKILK